MMWFVLKCNALHENLAALSSAKIMRIKASAASIIDVRDMMIGRAINITTTAPDPALHPRR
jgi:hypothetical protein